MLSNDEIREMLRDAFRPYQCVPEIWDYEEKLRFRIKDGIRDEILTVPLVLLREVRSEEELLALINENRDRVKARGYTLDPWQFPCRD